MALSLTLDVNDLTAQADFWSAALRYDVLHTSPSCSSDLLRARPGRGSNEFCAWTTLRDPEGNELCIEEVHT